MKGSCHGSTTGLSAWRPRPGKGLAFASGYVGAVIAGDFRDLFVAVASAGGALTGLLFVAMSVAPRRDPALGPRLIQQLRAAAALLSFTSALAVSLFALVPGTHVGYPATVTGVIGIFFTAAAMRSIVSSRSTARQKWRQMGLIALLLLIFGTELISGILAIGRPGDSGLLEYIGYALVASLIVGISRAWELVGDIDTGLFASLAVLAGHPRTLTGGDDASAAPGEPGTGQRGTGERGSGPAR
jgi:hypothetical protein